MDIECEFILVIIAYHLLVIEHNVCGLNMIMLLIIVVWSGQGKYEVDKVRIHC
jgi:hypothetical protein